MGLASGLPRYYRHHLHQLHQGTHRPRHRHLFDAGFKSIASRDIRLFLIMLGAIIGQAYFCLIVIAVLTNLVVFYRLIYIYCYLRQKANQPDPNSQSSEAP